MAARIAARISSSLIEAATQKKENFEKDLAPSRQKKKKITTF
jgi:hypothetical protein